MLKKKLVTRPVQTTAKQNIVKRPAASPVPTKPIPQEEEELEEDEAVEEEDEEAIEGTPPVPPKKTGSAKLGGGGKVSALAAAFDSVPLTNNAEDIPKGTYEALIKSLVLQEPDAKGQSARISFELCNPDFADSNQVTQWFKLIDGQGERVEGGIRALKQTLARLGYELKFSDLEEAFSEITEERPGVLIKVSYSTDQSGNTWQRATVINTCDNEVIQEYKDSIPY